jgi:hypothetical protein
MQVYYWWFDARERFAARQARQREEEYRRGTELAALRAGEEHAHVEARLGAVVPREVLPEEPALAELPADPVAAGEIASPPMDHVDADDEAAQQKGEFVPADRREAAGRAESGDWLREEIDRGEGHAGDNARRRRGS